MSESQYPGGLPSGVEQLEFDKFTLDEQNKVATRVKGNFTSTPSGLTTEGKFTEVNVNNTGWSALPATPLTGRNAIAIQNESGQDVKINFDNGEAGFKGMTIKSGNERYYDITDDIIVYAKSASSAIVLNIEEIA